jgi:prolyl-tRNA synthetase
MSEEQIRSGAGDVAVDEVLRGIEVANIFKLGTKYSESQKLLFLDENNAQKPVIMGCYGIGIDRLMSSIIEASHDERGMIWPKSVAPYLIYLVRIGTDTEVLEAADSLYDQLTAAGVEVFYDDRDAAPGEKFADADLIGIPYRITVSPKTLAEQACEVKQRTAESTELVKLGEITKIVASWM